MVDILDMVVFIIASIVIATLLFIVVKLSIQNRKLVLRAVQSEIDKIAMITELQRASLSRGDDAIEKTDGFLRFISESRDWAFEYIEDVQKAIAEYDSALSSQNPVAMNEAYKKLLSMLPSSDDMVS